jgi:hypothetical protein
MKTNIHFWKYFAGFFLEWEMLHSVLHLLLSDYKFYIHLGGSLWNTDEMNMIMNKNMSYILRQNG